MASSFPTKQKKRSIAQDAPVSPPPLKRRLKSETSQNAVSSFFTPASKKAPIKIIWQERAPNDTLPKTLIVGKYSPSPETSFKTDSSSPEKKRRKIAAFDFDSTLITTSSGKRFASDAQDWRWWHSSVPKRLKQLYHDEGFRIVIISNQAGIALKPGNKPPKGPQSKYTAFKTKVSAVLHQLDFPVNIYAATEKDFYRKPRTGMWTELLGDHDINLPGDVELEQSIFVGDAGGRDATGKVPKDFSCSDRNFAENIGIEFQTPEEFFLKETPRSFTRTFEPSEYAAALSAAQVEPFVKKNAQDIILFCGSPGAGKSTFYWEHLEPLGYARVNQDILKTRDKCIKVADELLKEGKSIAVDNTNSDTEVRAKWVVLAGKHSVPIRCVLFTTDSHVCEHNDAVRALNSSMNPEKRTILPSLAFRGFASRFQRPSLQEGFQDIVEWDFKFKGTEAERQIWTRHWT